MNYSSTLSKKTLFGYFHEDEPHFWTVIYKIYLVYLEIFKRKDLQFSLPFVSKMYRNSIYFKVLTKLTRIILHYLSAIRLVLSSKTLGLIHQYLLLKFLNFLLKFFLNVFLRKVLRQSLHQIYAMFLKARHVCLYGTAVIQSALQVRKLRRLFKNTLKTWSKHQI